MKTAKLALALAATVALSTLPAPAAAIESNFEIFAGGWFSGHRFDGDEPTFGVRGGFRFSDRWGLQGSLSRVELWDAGWHFWDWSLNATFLDVSALLYVTPRRPAELFVFGGPGFVTYDLGFGPAIVAVSDDDFTFHAGAGINVRLSPRMFLRPDLRVRWIGSLGGGSADVEATLGLGWKFGRGARKAVG